MSAPESGGIMANKQYLGLLGFRPVYDPYPDPYGTSDSGSDAGRARRRRRRRR